MRIRIDPTTVLLQVLLEGDGYGLELIDRIQRRTDDKILLPQASVYPTLRDLERDGLVRSYRGETVPARGGRPRIYYTLTAEGRRTAEEQRIALAMILAPVGGPA